MIKVSVICTLKNEESSVNGLLDSLLGQTRKPDEIIIVDGGSTDCSMNIISSYMRSGASINLIIKKGANIAEGRNIAIKNASYNYIASIDAGSKAHKDWLKNLIKPFEEDTDVDVVAGFFLPESKNIYEECVGELLYPKPEVINWDKFLPSGRSIAFKKECWERVSGFPEWLYTGEDALFDLKLREAGFKFAYAKDAVVYWRPRKNLGGLFKQYYLYAKGAAQGRFTSKFFFETYGKSPFFLILHNVVKLIAEKRRFIYLRYSCGIVVTVLMAKFLGTLFQKVKRILEL